MDSPLLRVVRGAPTDEELAALVAVLAARPAPEPAPPAAVSAWRDPAARLGVTRPGPLTWRASARPR
jgi:hypothetical protein